MTYDVFHLIQFYSFYSSRLTYMNEVLDLNFGSEFLGSQIVELSVEKIHVGFWQVLKFRPTLCLSGGFQRKLSKF
jgi:hypothetical protein